MKCILILFVLLNFQLKGQSGIDSILLWEISERGSIILNIDSLNILPHKDNIELSGKKISAIVYYEIDEDKKLTIEKDIIFPQLRTYNSSNEPDWKKYRAYFRRKTGNELTPRISCDNHTIVPERVDSIEINGMITFHYSSVNGIKLSKIIYPSMDERLLVEEWQIENSSTEPKDIAVSNFEYVQSENGYKGIYSFISESRANENTVLYPGETYSFPIIHGALLDEETRDKFDYFKARESRRKYLSICKENLILTTPNDTLNKLFHFSKIRAAESIFDSSMGLVHSPGGGNYYVGIWANDQIEYSGPYFPYMGYENGNTAAFNAYRKFMENMPEDGSHIAYAFEVDGNFPMTHLDRGDAAMIAYGTSLFLLNSGNIQLAEELWPLIEWSLEYCHNNRNVFGAIKSESDEMEGRISTGEANLSTSTLYYGGLKFGARIASELNMPSKVEVYQSRLVVMEAVIEDYFGATMEGLDTYRYFDENKHLRHWICLPLTMGITNRKAGTLEALFQKLWTDNGILVEYDPTDENKEHTFWDRATLYALRGAFRVGETDTAVEKLKQYSANRLLGEHVPYAIEAYPENNMKHLSAESALYCRIFIEGLLGIEPLSFSKIKVSPSLPANWEFLKLDKLHLFGNTYNIKVLKENDKLRLIVNTDSKVIYNQLVVQNEHIIISLK